MRFASFIVVFVFGFFLGGWFLMPHLPPVTDHRVSSLELEYWESTWAGVVLGVILASTSTRSTARRNSPTGPTLTPSESNRTGPC